MVAYVGCRGGTPKLGGSTLFGEKRQKWRHKKIGHALDLVQKSDSLCGPGHPFGRELPALRESNQRTPWAAQ